MKMLSNVSESDLRALLKGLRAVREARDKYLDQIAQEAKAQA
jgi:hypothetical protein